MNIDIGKSQLQKVLESRSDSYKTLMVLYYYGVKDAQEISRITGLRYLDVVVMLKAFESDLQVLRNQPQFEPQFNSSVFYN